MEQTTSRTRIRIHIRIQYCTVSIPYSHLVFTSCVYDIVSVPRINFVFVFGQLRLNLSRSTTSDFLRNQLRFQG